MATSQDLNHWIGQPVIASDGGAVGHVVDLYVDDDSGEPEWLAVDVSRTGALTYLPVAAVNDGGDAVSVPFELDHINGAPSASGDGILNREDEVALYRHYGVGATEPADDDDLTRSEEDLHIETRPVEAGRVRLRKVVDTEHVSVTVPVQRSEVRVALEPIADGENVATDDAFTEREVEVVLQEEEVIARTVTVAKERVRLETEVVTEERQVEADLRTERIELDDSTER